MRDPCHIYDKAGNRKRIVATGENSYTQFYSYDANNRLTGEAVLPGGSNTAVTHIYTYDNNGNRTSVEKMTVSINQGQHTKLGIYEDSDTSVASKDYYTYNELNQLTSVRSIGDSRNYRYAYLPNGLRYYKTDGTNYDYMYYDGDQICARACNPDNAFTHYYVFGLSRIKDNYGNHYVYNNHGDVTKLTNASGTVLRNYDYDAFGVEANKNANDTNPFRYCGEYYDIETGNIYLRARYYDPSVGSFISEDPVRDGVNWYSYCGSNPVNYIDPSGCLYLNLGNAIFKSYDEKKQQNIINKITKDIQELTNYKVTYHNGEFSIDVNNIVDTQHDKSSGNRLVLDIFNKENGGDSDIDYSIEINNEFKYFHDGEMILYNPNGAGAVWTEGKLVKTSRGQYYYEGVFEEKCNPTYIALAHEFIHAYRFKNGYTYIGKGYEAKEHYYRKGHEMFKDNSMSCEEYFTIGAGVYKTKSYVMSENTIRREHCLPYRTAHDA